MSEKDVTPKASAPAKGVQYGKDPQMLLRMKQALEKWESQHPPMPSAAAARPVDRVELARMSVLSPETFQRREAMMAARPENMLPLRTAEEHTAVADTARGFGVFSPFTREVSIPAAISGAAGAEIFTANSLMSSPFFHEGNRHASFAVLPPGLAMLTDALLVTCVIVGLQQLIARSSADFRPMARRYASAAMAATALVLCLDFLYDWALVSGFIH